MRLLETINICYGNFRELYLFLIVISIIDAIFHFSLRKNKKLLFYKNIAIYIVAIIYHLRLAFVLVPNSFGYSFIELYGSIFMKNRKLSNVRVELIIIVVLIMGVFIVLFSKLNKLLKEYRQE